MKFRKISPFCGQILESFPFIAEDFDQMTEYALYCKLKEKVDQMRIGINDLGDDVAEYIAKFDALKNYVDNYFDNLDVQDEIDNKLNEMAESGELQEIIADYLNSKAIFGFETVYDMRQATNLIEGSYAKTLGWNYINDGGSATYRIVNDPTLIEDNKNIINLNSGLKATLVKQNSIANEITCIEYVDNSTKTKYWIAHAPNKDKYGNVLKLKLGLAGDIPVAEGYLEKPIDYANKHNATILVNAGVSNNTGDNPTGYKFGMRMLNRQLISNRASDLWQIHWALGITPENRLVTFGPVQTLEEAESLDCVDVTSAFHPILLDGQSQKFRIEYTDQWFNMTATSDVTPDISKTYYTKNETSPYYTAHSNLEEFEQGVTYYEITNIKGQRLSIGQNTETGDIYFIASNGKGTYLNQGMFTDKIVQIYQSLGCDFAYQLDGGGSTSMVYKGEMVNQFTDEYNTEIRPCSDFLYIAYEKMNSQSEDINYINKRFGDYDVKEKTGKNYNLNLGYSLSSGDNLNSVRDIGVYYSNSGAITNAIINIPDFANKFPFIQTIGGFKLVVERIKANIVKQTLYLETDHVNYFSRVYYYNSSNQSYVWTDWNLITKENVGYTLSGQTGFTISNGMCRRKDNRFVMSAEVSGTFNQHNPTDIIQLPTGVKPRLYIFTTGVCVDSESHINVCQITVQNNGMIKATCPVASTKVKFSVAFDLE